jgi:hypothetical protein
VREGLGSTGASKTAGLHPRRSTTIDTISMNYPNHLVNYSHFKYNYCYSEEEEEKEENILAKGDKD